MEDDPLDHWTDEDEAAFQEYLKTHPELRPAVPLTRWVIQRYNRIPLLGLLEDE